ncbi:hypothetical protein CHS0354_041983 [Potamilus streckersoni]|uniref:Serine/threonine-protein kinase PLK4 n=1 Tax=Potamilus streckersoni TaxID=2493646 RepID=A0AAE0WAE4_9BIVA|nr:hypothetical protein CHS0354_041983 [Potamilus streckersoni]
MVDMCETIDDYGVRNLLGKGGFANVYRACHKKSGMDVAIKMIDKKLMKAANMVMRVKKEVEIHSQLKHPSILELYNYFEDSNYVYLVLEFCHNGELQRYLRTNCKALSEDEACHFMKQIVEGMLYLHSYGILHRDLTLANLLLTKDMNVKIADFGLATQLNVPDEKHFTMCGTPNYISPEVATRSAHGLEADVWSLGCMLYTFLVGKPPFDTDGVKSTLNRVINGDFLLPDHLSLEAKDLIESILKKNPKERIKLHEVLNHPFMLKGEMGYRKNSNQNLTEVSIDSGRGTMSTVTTLNSRITSGFRPRPMPALHLKSLKIPEDQERSYGDSDRSGEENQFVMPRKGPPLMSSPMVRHPPSPPVRLRDSEREMARQKMLNRANGKCEDFAQSPRTESSDRIFPENQKFVDNIFKTVSQTPDLVQRGSHSSDTGYGSKGSNYNDSEDFRNLGNNFRQGDLRTLQFDPAKYQERSQTPSGSNSSGWSCSASFHSNDQKGLTISGQCLSDGSAIELMNSLKQPSISTASDVSSQDEFSLQNTKKVLQFEGEISSRPHSLTEKYSRPAEFPEHDHAYHQTLQNYSDGSWAKHRAQYDRSISIEELNIDNRQWKLQTARSSSADNLDDLHDSQPKHFQFKEMLQNADATVNNSNPSAVKLGCTSKKGSLHFEGASAGSGKQEEKPVEGIQRAVSPLCSRRLRSIRQRTRNAIVNILDHGEVCLEFLKQKHKEEKVVEVFMISSDGNQINIYQPNNGKGEPVKDRPITPPSVPVKSYSYEELPEKYWKKYQYAARFVKLVRSKTPKVTLYTQRAKCMLMENGPDADFEAVFYDGAKFTSSSRGMRIIEKTGTSLVLESADMEQHLTQETQKLLEYVKQCRQQCLEIESVVTAVQQRCSLKEEFFPIIIGRRPNSNLNDSGKFSSASDGTSSEHNSSNPSSNGNPPPTMTSFDGTVVSNVTDYVDKSGSRGTEGNDSHDITLRAHSTVTESAMMTTMGTNPSPTNSQVQKLTTKDVVRQVLIKDIGRASQHLNGEIWVKFFDGNQIGVKSTTTTVKYIDPAGKLSRFQRSDILPPVVKKCLEKVPLVLEQLLQDSQSQLSLARQSSQ